MRYRAACFEDECGERNPEHSCYCVKPKDHIEDCTNDDHQCCSGHTWEED